MEDFYKYTFMIPMQAIATLPSVPIHTRTNYIVAIANKLVYSYSILK